MTRALLILVLIVAMPTPTLHGDPAYGPFRPEFCALVFDWKTVMKAKHPTVDRSVPEVARRCYLDDF